MTVQNQALSSADGILYSWVTASPDWAASSFPGPGSALHIAVSMAPATPGSGGGVTDHNALTSRTDVNGHSWAELAQRPLASYTAASNDAALADVRKCIITTRGSAIALRIRLQAAVAWLAETMLGGINTGAGTLTLTAEGGVTLNGSLSVPPHGWWWAKRIALNTWQCFTGGSGSGGGGSGDLKADGTVPLAATWPLGGQALIGGKSFLYANEINNTGATPAINFAATGDLQKITLSGNVAPTFVAPLGLGYVLISTIGDGTQRTITWPVSVVGTPPAPRAGAGVRTFYPLYYDGTSYHYDADAAAYLKLDGTVAMAADLNLGTHKVTAMSPGTVGTDGVNKNQLDAVAAAGSGKFGFQYTFATSTTDADPGAGLVRFNNATLASVTQIYLDLVDADGNTLTNWIASLDDALGTVKGFIYFRDIADDTKWGQYRLDSITSPGGYVKLNVTFIVAGAGGLPATTAAGTLLSFDAWGNGPAAGNGLTGTSTLAVLPEDTTITVGAGGVKRPAITGIVTIAAGSNVSAIADGAIPRAKLAPEIEYDNGNSGTADTIAAANGTYQKSTLTGNCTYTLTPPASGVFEIELRLIQGGTGSYTATWPATVIWPASGPPRLSTVVGDEDFVVLSWKGANWYGNPPPEVPDGRVVQWDDATSALFTSTLPVGGGKNGVDPARGLSWQGKNGVETTIAPHGDSANTTKRRFAKFITRPFRGTLAALASATLTSFDCTDINGRAFVSGMLKAKLHLMAQGQYTTVAEYLLAVSVDGGSIASIGGAPTPTSNGGGLSMTLTFGATGPIISCDATAGATYTNQYWGFWEIDGFEL